jgi:hypothetical protein
MPPKAVSVAASAERIAPIITSMTDTDVQLRFIARTPSALSAQRLNAVTPASMPAATIVPEVTSTLLRLKEHDMLQPYRVYLPETQALLDDARRQGEQRGRVEGEQRGRAEGERRGRLEGLRIGWAARFGGEALPPELDAALAQADLPALLRAAPDLLAAPDPEAAAAGLRAALTLSATGPQG